MRIVCALDVHRRQITYAIVDVRSGELSRGRITPATRESVREWLARFDSLHDVHFALEGTTGWRFVAEEVSRAGHRAHLADPAETAVKRGRKRRAKTDRADCDLLVRLLSARELPESWIPPAQILELRTRVRLRKTVVDERTAWQQRLQAQLFHQGVPAGVRPRTRAGRGHPRSLIGAVGCVNSVLPANDAIARNGSKFLHPTRSSDMADAPEPVSACGASRQAQHFVQARFRPGELVEIGKPERTYTVEPLEDPVPRELPTEPAESPVEPSPEEPISPRRARAP